MLKLLNNVIVNASVLMSWELACAYSLTWPARGIFRHFISFICGVLKGNAECRPLHHAQISVMYIARCLRIRYIKYAYRTYVRLKIWYIYTIHYHTYHGLCLCNETTSESEAKKGREMS